MSCSNKVPAIIDPKDFIKERLGEIEGVEIHDASKKASLPPNQRKTKTPKITITALDNHNVNVVVDFLSYQLEVTAETDELCDSVAERAAEIMSSTGFKRAMDSGCFWSSQHYSRVQRYTAQVDKRSNRVLDFA